MKFITLLKAGSQWAIKRENEHIDSVTIKNRIMHTLKSWEKQLITLNQEQYVIAVGYDPLDYFFFTILASYLGIKIILCDAKMLDILLENYPLNYQAIISSREIKSISIPVYLISQNSNDSENLTLNHAEKLAQILFFTSGTTSIPKLVVYEEDILVANAKKVGEYLEIKPQDTTLCLFPTNYMYGFSTIMSALFAGSEILLGRPTTTAREIWDLMIHKKVKFLPLIRSLIDQVNQIAKKHPDLYFEDLVMLNASDRIYIEQIEGLLQYCPLFWNNFGQTESGPRIFAQKITKNDLHRLDQLSYQGVIAPGKPIDTAITIEILDDQNQNVENNQIGNLYYTSPYAMLGYLSVTGQIEKKEKIASGDLVYRDTNGMVFWVGRKKEIIKINGKFVNISLLHKKFDLLKSIERSYFIFDPHSGFLTGFFVPKDLSSICVLEQYLRRYYRECFPTYPRMHKLQFVESIPTTLTDKVNLRKLQNHYTTEGNLL